MRKAFLIVTLLVVGCVAAHAQPAPAVDSTVKRYGDFWCQCIDTVNLNRPVAEIKKSAQLCGTLGLTVLLNDRLVTPDVLTDDKKMQQLQGKTLQYMMGTCDKMEQLALTLDKSPEFAKQTPANYFLPAAYFKQFGLEAGQTNEHLHVYNNLQPTEPAYQRVVDIRWVFKSNAEALEWHEKELEQNSEGGEPVKETIAVPGSEELKIYREGSSMAKSMAALGVPQRHHYFIFVYKNVACKIFIATNTKTDTKTLAPIAVAAVEQLKKAM